MDKSELHYYRRRGTALGDRTSVGGVWWYSGKCAVALLAFIAQPHAGLNYF